MKMQQAREEKNASIRIVQMLAYHHICVNS